MTGKRLTIAIPTYNRADLLQRAIESALAQTSDQIEILVSDNGSTDATPEVIAKYRDPRLRAIRRETTVSRANHGTLIFAEVTTELVLALSDDDYIEPTFAAEVINVFDEHPEISFAYTGCMEHYDDVTLPALVGPRMEASLDFILAHYVGQRQVSWCACVTRAADLRRLGPQPEDVIIGDMFFWTKIAFQGPVGCIARPLSHYSVLRPAGDNESRTTPIIPWADDILCIMRDVLARVMEHGANPAYLGALQASMHTYMTRSLSNQFLWARLSGMSQGACLRVVPSALRFKTWTIESLFRLFGALLLPRRAIRRLLIRAVAKRANARGGV